MDRYIIESVKYLGKYYCRYTLENIWPLMGYRQQEGLFKTLTRKILGISL
jgi:hypothetical protein